MWWRMIQGSLYKTLANNIMSSSNYMLTGQEVQLIRTPMSVTVIGVQILT